jgi:ATP-binding cassette subfamily B protein
MTETAALKALEWPRDKVGDALDALSGASGVGLSSMRAWSVDAGPTHALAATRSPADAVATWAEHAGLDAEPVDLSSRAPVETLREVVPALVHVPGRSGLLVVLRVTGARATLLGPRGRANIPASLLEDAFASAPLGANTPGPESSILRAIECVAPGRRALAARVLLAPAVALAGRSPSEAWSLRPGAAGFGDALRGVKVHRRITGVAVGYFVQFALFLALWRQVALRAAERTGHGDGAPHGGSDWPWFMALMTLWVVVQLAASAAVSRLALDIGAAVRVGLMRGALRLDPERIRSAGVGQLLGRALDSEALDALALGGGVEAVAGAFEMALGGLVLAWGVTPVWSLAILATGVAVLCALGWTHVRRLRAWGQTRRSLTHDLVERMVGHRTVLIQDRHAGSARADDASLGAYDAETRALDYADIGLAVELPRAWLLAGLLALAPSALSSAANPGVSLALSLGGVWLVYGAFRRLGVALPMLALARDAWGQISPLVGAVEPGVAPSPGWAAPTTKGDVASLVGAVLGVESDAAASAGGAPEKQGEATLAEAGRRAGDPRVVPPGAPPSPALLVADDVSYRYPGRESAVLNGVTLALHDGERVLLEGASGGGKSTLAALLTGLKAPMSGHLRLRGVDQRAFGLAHWRGAIGGAPQFHDNHLFAADLLFNLLMGRRWPPRLEDVQAAERVCRELGLGPLLDRMPAGLQQQIGETGWQLSHGERSRVFIARSLLQPLAARVLDESFAALDPATLDQVMGAVLARPEALIVIAHP